MQKVECSNPRQWQIHCQMHSNWCECRRSSGITLKNKLGTFFCLLMFGLKLSCCVQLYWNKDRVIILTFQLVNYIHHINGAKITVGCKLFINIKYFVERMFHNYLIILYIFLLICLYISNFIFFRQMPSLERRDFAGHLVTHN